MAQTTQDTTLFSESSGKESKGQAVESEGGEVEVAVSQKAAEATSSTPQAPGTDVHTEKAASQTSTDGLSSEPSSRPSLVPLGSSHTQSSTLTPIAPHPKRFSAVNINKKFLEKNTASGSAATSSTSSAAKSGSPSTRPSVQPTSSHSRLVTAKLTASPAVASSTAGWSRPSSVAPSPATTSSPISTSPLPTAPALQPSTTSAPQLPHVGKVILPQARAAMTQLVSSQKDTTAPKPVWGNVKPPTAAPIRPDIQPDDFPTAAEVAQSTTRKQTKAEEMKALDTTAKQLRSEEADTFRGVHLDPNAHHWDEIDEDDDNFLDGVIEFGDGRQYKIETNEPRTSSTSPTRAGSTSRPQTGDSTFKEPSTGPVSKEERFVDDFDRSWPKSRTSPPTAPRDFPPPAVPQSASPIISPVSHATHSPQDSSRVLFNERSNRLEPYSQSHRPRQGPFDAKRPGFPDGSGPMDSRNARDGPHNIQVLQKPAPGDARSRRYSGSNNNNNFNAGPVNGFGGDRNRRDMPPPSPRMTRDPPPHTIDAGHRDWEHNDRGRRSAMGPPPLPAHAMKQEGGRQLPPHLAQVSPNISSRRLPSRDSRFSPSEPPASARLPPQSPAISHASLSLVSPAAVPNVPLPISAPDMEEVRKDVMHTAAERAKQRRQQEEAEREAQKERARRKAAEIEERLKAAEAEKQKEKDAQEAAKSVKEEAVQLIEEAVKSVEIAQSASEKVLASRPPPLKTATSEQPTSELLRSATLKRGPLSPRNGPPSAIPTTPSMQTESWRSRTAPLPPPTPRQIQQIQPRPTIPASASTNFVDSGPSAAEQVETIAEQANDDLEVVDFSDLAKFVGGSEATSAPAQVAEENAATIPTSKSSRPVAADFFDEPPSLPDTVPPNKQAEFGAWRRKVSQDISEPPAARSTNDITVDLAESGKKVSSSSPENRISPTKERPQPSASPEISTTTSNRDSSHQADILHAQLGQVSPNSNQQRTPRVQPFYKEAAMSALDDAMSRIKGVLVGMHANEAPIETATDATPTQDVQHPRTALVSQPQPPISQTPVRSIPKDRWVPPALRTRRFDGHDEPRENFLVTIPQLPPSPESRPTLKFPTVSLPVDVISKKQLLAFSRPPLQARMDILSFDPPVHDMNRRDLSLNDVLFRRAPSGYKGKIKYRVSIPRFRGPRVSIPNTGLKPNGTGAFGRPTPADGASTWRKAAVSPSAKMDFDTELSELNTMSRSPPPDHTPPGSAIALIPKTNENSPTKSDGNASSRSRTQPKMPEGSAVAFIRDSRIDVAEADTKPLVNFIVGSQLDESKSTSEMTVTSTSPLVGSKKTSKPATNGIITTPNDKDESPKFASVNDESKASDDIPAQVLATPPTRHSSASWTRSSVSLTKESPARAPDPEHLKAVWSQTSNKAGLHPVNSLEGIADDLTALPFTLQDVKSEDGETPPPSLPSAPSRMSLHEVTRAFQTVPTSSSNSSQPTHRATFSPPSTQAPVARPTAAPYGYSPVPQNNMRPAYVSYPSPMMSHSPAPPVPVMYPHHMASSPGANRMQVNGHTSLYSQPMWVVPAPSQAHANMMRPPGPYPGQMIPYPTPMYATQPPMPSTPQAQNGGRGRGMPVMSPVMGHAHAHAHPGASMYSGSPVMLHAVQVPQNHSYSNIPMPAGRGQPRTDNGQMPTQQQHLVHHPAPHGGFNPNPASPFVRTQW